MSRRPCRTARAGSRLRLSEAQVDAILDGATRSEVPAPYRAVVEALDAARRIPESVPPGDESAARHRFRSSLIRRRRFSRRIRSVQEVPGRSGTR